jgi:hypothetical protein
VPALTEACGASYCNISAKLPELIIGALPAEAYDPINLSCIVRLQMTRIVRLRIERGLLITVDWHAMD